MSPLTLHINTTVATSPRKLVLELDAAQFEKLAGDFGFFSPEFIKSLERAEADAHAGRVRTITSLKELRRTHLTISSFIAYGKDRAQR